MTIFTFKNFCKHKLTAEHTGIFTICSLWAVLNYSLLTLSKNRHFLGLPRVSKSVISRFAQSEQIGDFSTHQGEQTALYINI